VFAGVGLVVVLTPDEIRLLQLSHHRGGASWGIAGELVAVAARGSCRFVRVWFLDVVVVSRSTTASVDFVLRLQPRRAGVPSVAAVELVSLCTGGPSPAVLAAVLLQVVRPAFVGDSYLPAGRIRAVCPADALPSVFKSRRIRRVGDAATSTRLCPLKSPFGDSVTACGCFGVISGERAQCFQAVADRAERRRHLGPVRVFPYLQGVFCNLWTAVFLLDGSCSLLVA
jgi:hypothetical protein